MDGAGKGDINLMHKRLSCGAQTTTTTGTITATLVGNLAILADIERKLDIIAEILADQATSKTETQDHDGKF